MVTQSLSQSVSEWLLGSLLLSLYIVSHNQDRNMGWHHKFETEFGWKPLNDWTLCLMDSNCINRSVSFMVDTDGMWTQLNGCFKMSCLIQRHFKVFTLNWTSEVTSVTQSAQSLMLDLKLQLKMTYSKNRKWSKAEELLLILISYLSPLLINATLARSHNLHVVDRIDKSRVLCHQFIDQCSATNPSTKYYLNKTDNRQTLWLNGGIMTHQLQ